jgi:predicted GH43/DUF377 family glycosyl hydrolase
MFDKLKKYGIILKIGKIGEFDSGMIEGPVVWFDKNLNKYGMVYVGYELVKEMFSGYKSVSNPKIGLAWSDDLLFWEKDKRNPIFGPSGIVDSADYLGASGPFIWHEEGVYYLFYFGLTGAGYEAGNKTLNLAVSDNLYSWKRYESNPIIIPSGNGFRRDAIWHPNVVKHNEKYFLFFNASGVHDGVEEEFIGYAVSDDLKNWKVEDKNSPILTGSGIKGEWDSSSRAGDPSVFRIDKKWYMAYYSWDNIHTQDGIATTSDEEFPLGWKPLKKNPILKLGAPGSYDDLHAGKPFVLTTQDCYYHFYTAVDRNEKREIALAIEKF